MLKTESKIYMNIKSCCMCKIKAGKH